jgi:hypothetical protein
MTEDHGPPRDGWGRYLVPREDDDGRVALTRATTVAKAPEDQAGLMKWEGRMVALGLARRPDLLALIATTDPTDKTALNRICMDAKEAGGATQARNTGTALHATIEAINRGQEPLPLFTVEVDAYRAALAVAGIEPVPELVERIVVDHERGIAGTFDVALRDASGALYVADVKTGSVDYPASFAIQLAIYAGAPHLLSEDYERLDAAPGFDRRRAVIIHLPEGGPCTLHWLDIAKGSEGLDLALAVRRWRSEAKASTLLSPIAESSDGGPPSTAVVERGEVSDAGTAPAPPLPTRERIEWFVARYDELREAVPAERIAHGWPEGVPGPRKAISWTSAEMDAAVAHLTRIEDDHGLPYPSPDPTAPAPDRRGRGTVSVVTSASPPPSAPNDGPLMGADDVVTLRRRHAALPKAAKERVDQWVREGAAASRPWGMGKAIDAVPRRRWECARASIGLARRTEDDEIARGWIALVVGEDAIQTHPVGALIGSLTIEEADQLAALAESHKDFAGAVQALAS